MQSKKNIAKIIETAKRKTMLEVTEIDVAEINLFVLSREFGMLCMILEILVVFHNEAVAVDARQDLKIFTSSLVFFINLFPIYELVHKKKILRINPLISIDILAEINDIVGFELIFEQFGSRFKTIEYDIQFDPVVASFIDFFDLDSPAAEIAAKALIAVNTEINMINFIATADLTIGKFCEGFVENYDISVFVETFTCICKDNFEFTLDATGYGTCACADGEINVDGVCVKA